jgi:citrate lyase synthetase
MLSMHVSLYLKLNETKISSELDRFVAIGIDGNKITVAGGIIKCILHSCIPHH